MGFKRGCGLGALLAAMVLQVGDGMAPQPAAATVPGANGRIAYTFSGREGDRCVWGIGTVRSNGGADRVLWRRPCSKDEGCPIACGEPAWSPDGRRLVFDAGKRLAMMRSDGSRFHLLPSHSPDDGAPTFSPDGKKIAFTALRGSDITDLLVLNLASGRTRELARNARQPSWSSRGQIAFVRGRNVYTIPSRGVLASQLTYRGGSEPDWSPSGTRVAFVRDRPNSRGLATEIYLIRADGRGLHRLPRAGIGVDQPVWSPAGDAIAYYEVLTGIVTRAPSGQRRELVIESQTGDTGSTDASEPAWQPR